MNRKGYARYFEGLTWRTLLDLEVGPDGNDEDMDAPRDYVEGLLLILTQWKTAIESYRDRCMATPDEPLHALFLRGLHEDVAEYRRALDRVREAQLQYDYRDSGGGSRFLPDSFDIEVPSKRGGR